MTRTTMHPAIALAAFLVVAFLPATIGSRWMPDAWYVALQKPAWNPPNGVFAPVWTTLYALIGVSGWLAWREVWEKRAAAAALGRTAFVFYAAQLALNAAWSWLFFGLHRPGVAFAEILLMWVAILANTVAFWRVRPLAGALLLPYLAWVTFAAVLNGTLWRMNAPS